MKENQLHRGSNAGRLAWLVALVLLLSTLLAACGGDNNPTTTAANPTTSGLATSQGNTAQSGDTTQPGNTTTAAIATTSGPTFTPATTVVAPGASGTPTPTAGAKGGATMKEAFVAVDPQVKAWADDAVYVTIFNNLEKQLGIDADGRSQEWYFQAISLKAGRRTTWLASAEGGKITVSKSGDEELPADRLKFQADQALPPISTLIDTNELMAVARDNGGDKSDRPVGFRLAKPAKEGASLSYDLIFEQGAKTILIRVDALTGKVLDSAKG